MSKCQNIKMSNCQNVNQIVKLSQYQMSCIIRVCCRLSQRIDCVLIFSIFFFSKMVQGFFDKLFSANLCWNLFCITPKFIHLQPAFGNSIISSTALSSFREILYSSFVQRPACHWKVRLQGNQARNAELISQEGKLYISVQFGHF